MVVRDDSNILWAEFDVNGSNQEFVRFIGSILAPATVQLYERDGILTDTFVGCGPSKARELKRKLDKLLVVKDPDAKTSRVKATLGSLWNPSPRALRGRDNTNSAYSQDTFSSSSSTSSTTTLAPSQQQPPTEFWFVQEGVIFLFFVVLALLFSGEFRKTQRKKDSKERKKLLRKKLQGVSGVDIDDNDDDNSIDTVDKEAIEEADKFIMLNNFRAYGFF